MTFSFTCPVFLFPSCRQHEIEKEPTFIGTSDSVRVSFVIKNLCSWAEPKEAELFIYEKGTPGKLLQHSVYDVSDGSGMDVSIEAGGKAVAVLVTDSPLSFKMQALEKFDAMEQLLFKFEDDNPERPLMSGMAEFTRSGGSYEILLRPLMCRVILDEISNGIRDYILLENPRIHLEGINASARLLQMEDIRARESLTQKSPVSLPCEIGFYSQYPGTTLYCYPNEISDDLLGILRTEFVLECDIRGSPYSFRQALPSMPRGSTVHLSASVDSPTLCFWKQLGMREGGL